MIFKLYGINHLHMRYKLKYISSELKNNLSNGKSNVQLTHNIITSINIILNYRSLIKTAH